MIEESTWRRKRKLTEGSTWRVCGIPDVLVSLCVVYVGVLCMGIEQSSHGVLQQWPAVRCVSTQPPIFGARAWAELGPNLQLQPFATYCFTVYSLHSTAPTQNYHGINRFFSPTTPKLPKHLISMVVPPSSCNPIVSFEDCRRVPELQLSIERQGQPVTGMW